MKKVIPLYRWEVIEYFFWDGCPGSAEKMGQGLPAPGWARD